MDKLINLTNRLINEARKGKMNMPTIVATFNAAAEQAGRAPIVGGFWRRATLADYLETVLADLKAQQDEAVMAKRVAHTIKIAARDHGVVLHAADVIEWANGDIYFNFTKAAHALAHEAKEIAANDPRTDDEGNDPREWCGNDIEAAHAEALEMNDAYNTLYVRAPGDAAREVWEQLTAVERVVAVECAHAEALEMNRRMDATYVNVMTNIQDDVIAAPYLPALVEACHAEALEMNFRIDCTAHLHCRHMEAVNQEYVAMRNEAEAMNASFDTSFHRAAKNWGAMCWFSRERELAKAHAEALAMDAAPIELDCVYNAYTGPESLPEHQACYNEALHLHDAAADVLDASVNDTPERQAQLLNEYENAWQNLNRARKALAAKCREVLGQRSGRINGADVSLVFDAVANDDYIPADIDARFIQWCLDLQA